jgi:hypothetical protein
MRDDALPTPGWPLGWLGFEGFAEAPNLVPSNVLQNSFAGAILSHDRLAIAEVGKRIEWAAGVV